MENARATAEPALPGRWWRPLEGEAPKALRGWAFTSSAMPEVAALGAVVAAVLADHRVGAAFRAFGTGHGRGCRCADLDVGRRGRRVAVAAGNQVLQGVGDGGDLRVMPQ